MATVIAVARTTMKLALQCAYIRTSQAVDHGIPSVGLPMRHRVVLMRACPEHGSARKFRPVGGGSARVAGNRHPGVTSVTSLRLCLATLALVLFAPWSAFAADDLSGAHDFDFEFGDWTVHHKLKRATGEWIEFEGTSVTWPVLDGRGNVEDNVFHRPGGDTRGLA